ncbi:hypothetical protein FNV43_RR12059 [Rhamnella rubrinervis]|uniref:Uncharacterized protein n=1 Tax=Rhamnella rubrinervis TaxID=2594499 RepID=A0A8K0H7G3_9ROSA|nr:hypothetical protein FNV43_RR12059 [Rhamnella rubrinervis]
MEKEKEKEKKQQRRVEAEREKQIREDHAHHHQEPPPNISPMEPITHGAYGGGMYGIDDDQQQERQQHKQANKPPASETQSADGPAESVSSCSANAIHLKHKPPPSSGDRDIDITGQSYIQ